MIPLRILVADGTMEVVLRRFFSRQRYFDSLGCSEIVGFQPSQHITHDANQTDGAIHRRAHELVRPFRRSTARLVVVFDAQFGGERPALEVRGEVLDLLRPEWGDDADVVVIEPELEVWLWQDNPNVARALRWDAPPALRDALHTSGEWPYGQIKPSDPKGTIQRLLRRPRVGSAKVVYGDIASTVSVSGCGDPSFRQLCARLRAWFPREEE